MSKDLSVKVFRISGSFKKRQETTDFSKEICALTEEHAKEKLYAEFGSRNRIKRRKVSIKNIDEISFDEITDPYVQKIVTGDFKIPYKETT